MDYKELNQYLLDLDIDQLQPMTTNTTTNTTSNSRTNTKANDNTKNDINVNSLQRSLELSNNEINPQRITTLNNNMNIQPKIKTDNNQRLNERSNMPCATTMPIGNKDMMFDRFSTSSRTFNETN